MDERKRICEGKRSISELCTDCVFKITLYFESSKEVVNFICIDKQFNQIGNSKGFHGFENAVFSLTNVPGNVPSRPLHYVKRFCLNHPFFDGYLLESYDRRELSVMDTIFDHSSTVVPYLRSFPCLKVLDFSRRGHNINSDKIFSFRVTSNLENLTSLFLSPPLLTDTIFENIGEDIILNLREFGFEFLRYTGKSGFKLYNGNDGFIDFCETLSIFRSRKSKLRKARVVLHHKSRTSYGKDSVDFLFLNHFNNVQELDLQLEGGTWRLYYDENEKSEDEEGRKVEKFSNLRTLRCKLVPLHFLKNMFKRNKCESLRSLTFEFEKIKGKNQQSELPGIKQLNEVVNNTIFPKLEELAFIGFSGTPMNYNEKKKADQQKDVICLQAKLKKFDIHRCRNVVKLFFPNLGYRDRIGDQLTSKDVETILPYVENVVLCCPQESCKMAHAKTRVWEVKDTFIRSYTMPQELYCKEFCAPKSKCQVSSCEKKNVYMRKDGYFFSKKEIDCHCTTCGKLACAKNCLRYCRKCGTSWCKDCFKFKKDSYFSGDCVFEKYKCLDCDNLPFGSENYKDENACDVCGRKDSYSYMVPPGSRCICCKKRFSDCCSIEFSRDDDFCIDIPVREEVEKIPLCKTCFDKKLVFKCRVCKKKCCIFELKSVLNWETMKRKKSCSYCVDSDQGNEMGEIGMMWLRKMQSDKMDELKKNIKSGNVDCSVM